MTEEYQKKECIDCGSKKDVREIYGHSDERPFEWLCNKCINRYVGNV